MWLPCRKIQLKPASDGSLFYMLAGWLFIVIISWEEKLEETIWITCNLFLCAFLMYCKFWPCMLFFSGYIEEACIVPCPSDCKLSEWSNWSRCSKSCGSGVKVRSKWLREKPYNGGRPCPKLDHLNQVNVTLPFARRKGL